MKPNEKMPHHSKGLKETRKDVVLSAALTVFGAQGIEATTMVDVSKAAKIGVASLYRYYSTKFELSLACAIALWKEELNPVFFRAIDDPYDALNGLDQVLSLLKVTLNLMEDHTLALRFMEYFDNFVVSQSIDPACLVDYEVVVGAARPIFMAALSKGKHDGSIRPDLKDDAFYLTITHTLMSLAQKLILRGQVIVGDGSVEKSEQIKLVIEMANTYIKNPVR